MQSQYVHINDEILIVHFFMQQSPYECWVECWYSMDKIQMKKYQEKAIPLIVKGEAKGKSAGEYEANPEALAFLRSIEGKVAVVSVAGMYRTGKSYLLNTILLKQKGGFAVGPTTNPKTKGIWVWGKPLIFKNEKDQMINVVVMDSEGLGSTEEDVNHDLRLFSLTLLLSSMFIYNSLGAIDEAAIDSLGLVLRLCEQLRAEDYSDFPDFYWVLRDFSLALVGRDNKPLTANKYLQNSLAEPSNKEVCNRIRQSIRAAFPNRSCYTFVRPVTNEEELQKLDTLDLDQLRPEFTEQVLDFRRLIAANIRTKRIKGKEITAGLLVDLVRVYLAEINNKKLPEIQTGWKYVCARECEGVLEAVEKEAEQSCNKLLESLPSTKKELAERQEALMEQLTRLFDSRTLGNDQAGVFRGEVAKVLARRMAKVEEEMRVRNPQETKSFIKKEFEQVERRLKGGQFKSMGELVKEFQLFYEYYRKKCPFKDEVQTGLQFLMKKFSDCSLLMFKNFKARRDQQVLRLREENDKLTSEFASKEERQKHERAANADKVAVLESRIDQLQRQNRELAEALANAEAELERRQGEAQERAAQMGQEAELELISLRKKLLEAEDQLREADCRRMLEVNNASNALVLKQNELVHFQEAMAAQAARSAAAIKDLTAERDERDKKLEELTGALERVKSEAEKAKRLSDERLREKFNDISRMEQILEEKDKAMVALSEKAAAEGRALRETWEAEKAALEEAHREELKSVAETQRGQAEERALRVRKAESDMAARELELRMERLELDKQAAILTQKLQFLKQECKEKEQRLAKFQEENAYYSSLFEEKDSEINNLSTILEEHKSQLEATTIELTARLEEANATLADRAKEIAKLEDSEQRLKVELKEREAEARGLAEKIRQVSKSAEERVREMAERLNWEVQSAQKSRAALEAEIELLRTENSKSTEEQKRNIELSLVQLKNYYEMERERLQKKNLETRKKHQQSQSNALAELDSKHRKAQRLLQDELQQLRAAKEALQDQLTRQENDFDIRIMAAEEERENERRMLTNRLELLQKKHQETVEDFEAYERSAEEQRITFVKRVQGLTFELGRKEKELLQSNSRRQSLEAALRKKETAMEGVKRLMNTEIEGSLKKVADIQAKYQRLNEEYMQYKIEADKEIALCRQRNDFLNAKLNDVAREKDSASSKNIQRLDRQKIADMKQQIDKHKADLIALETKNEGLRRSLKEQEAAANKRLNALEKEKDFLQQKEAINLAKLADLEAKLAQKADLFGRELEQARGKGSNELAQKEAAVEMLKQQLAAAEDLRSQETWTLKKDIALLNERVKYAEYQRDQLQKDREDAERRLQTALEQIRKSNEKLTEDSQNKRSQADKKYVGQLEALREVLRTKEGEYQELLRKQKEEGRALKDKNQQLMQRIQALQKQRAADRNYQDEIEALKREKENLMLNYRNERARQNDQWKRRNNDLDKKCKELEKKNMQSIFNQEKETSKWNMERDGLLEKIKQLEDNIQWEHNKNQLNKSKNQLKRSQSGNIFSTTSSGGEFRSFGGWK